MRMKLNESSVKKLTPPPAGYALCWDEELYDFRLRVTVGRWPADLSLKDDGSMFATGSERDPWIEKVKER